MVLTFVVCIFAVTQYSGHAALLHPADGNPRVDGERFAAELCLDEAACKEAFKHYTIDAGVMGFDLSGQGLPDDGIDRYLHYTYFSVDDRRSDPGADDRLLIWFNGGPGAPQLLVVSQPYGRSASTTKTHPSGL